MNPRCPYAIFPNHSPVGLCDAGHSAPGCVLETDINQKCQTYEDFLREMESEIAMELVHPLAVCHE